MTNAMSNPYAYPRADFTAEPTKPAGPMADRGRRLVAVFLNSLLVVPIGVAGGALSSVLQGDVVMIVMALILLGLLTAQAALLASRGQSLGKIWAGVRIVKVDGGQAGFTRAVLLRSILVFALSLIPGFGLIDALFIFRADRRCIHDLIAGTVVVEA